MYSGPLSLFPTFSAWRRPITGSLSMRHVAINVGDVHGPLHGVPGVHTNVPIYSISIGPTPLCRRCPWAVYVSLGPSGSLWLGRPPAAFPPTIRVTGCRPQRYLSSINKRITKGIYTDLRSLLPFILRYLPSSGFYTYRHPWSASVFLFRRVLH